jgi:hypothetical protein
MRGFVSLVLTVLSDRKSFKGTLLSFCMQLNFLDEEITLKSKFKK